MTMKQSLTWRAPAKLNLALAVGPPATSAASSGLNSGPNSGADPGADPGVSPGAKQGLHPICSWMMTVDLFDELLVTKLQEDRFSRYAILWHEDAKRTSEIDWSITSDLAVRAHMALEERVGYRLPVQLKLEKRIPVGGGLGGGSSNAAAMLLAVNELYGLGHSVQDLAEIGAGLGSDIPFFVYGGSAIVSGTGERVEVQEHVPELHAVVAFPEVACPTGRVYQLFDETSPSPLRDDAVMKLASVAPDAPRPDALFNDLARAAVRCAPELDEHLAKLSALAERPAHVSGSGSSIFVLCDDALHAEALAGAVHTQLELPAVAVRSYEQHGATLDR